MFLGLRSELRHRSAEELDVVFLLNSQKTRQRQYTMNTLTGSRVLVREVPLSLRKSRYS